MTVYVVWYTDNDYVGIVGVFAKRDAAELALDAIEWYDNKGIREHVVTP